LEYEELHNMHGVHVRSAPTGALVGVEVSKYGSELFSIYLFLGFCEFVAEFLYVPVGFS
jgi:hypothetical protein